MPILKRTPPKAKHTPKKKKSSVNSRQTFIHVLLFHQPTISPYLQCSSKQHPPNFVSFPVVSLVSLRVGYNETLPLNSETLTLNSETIYRNPETLT